MFDDVVYGAQIVDALANLDFVMSMFLPSDVPDEQHGRRQMAVMLEESTKPIVFVGKEAQRTRFAVEMAEALAEGLSAL